MPTRSRAPTPKVLSPEVVEVNAVPVLAWKSLKGKQSKRRVQSGGGVSAPTSVLAHKGQGHSTISRRREEDRIARENDRHARKLRSVTSEVEISAIRAAKQASNTSTAINRRRFEHKVAQENKVISHRLKVWNSEVSHTTAAKREENTKKLEHKRADRAAKVRWRCGWNDCHLCVLLCLLVRLQLTDTETSRCV